MHSQTAAYFQLVGPLKKFKNKKAMWQQIALDLKTDLAIEKTFTQCENRYKTILKRNRVSMSNSHTSGAKRMRVDFENEFQKIAAIDDSLEPEVLKSSNKEGDRQHPLIYAIRLHTLLAIRG